MEWSDEPDSDVKGVDGAGCSVLIDIAAVDTESSTVEGSDELDSDLESVGWVGVSVVIDVASSVNVGTVVEYVDVPEDI